MNDMGLATRVRGALLVRGSLGVAAAVWLVLSPAVALADARIGKFTVTFAEGVFHRNGDFVIPGAVNGRSSDGDFRADRAFGNYQRQDVTLVGHVVLHRRPQAGPASLPITLTANQLRVEGKTDIYTATGSVGVTQGNRQLHSDYLRLDNRSHDGVLRGSVRAQEGDRVINTAEVHYNTASGALLVPTPLNGFSPGSDFRADRAVGNNRAGTLTLVGNVLVHRFNYGKANQSSEPLTLWCDKLDIANRPQAIYTATGHVRVAQGDRTLVAPVLKLNDTTHIATMTGGVHGEEPPDRTFDAAELIYDTQTEDFKALGGVTATFPFRRGQFASSPAPRASSHGTPGPPSRSTSAPSPAPSLLPSPRPSVTSSP